MSVVGAGLCEFVQARTQARTYRSEWLRQLEAAGFVVFGGGVVLTGVMEIGLCGHECPT